MISLNVLIVQQELIVYSLIQSITINNYSSPIFYRVLLLKIELAAEFIKIITVQALRS